MKLIPEYKCLICGKKRDGIQTVSSDITEGSKTDMTERLINYYMSISQRDPERFICQCDETHVGCMVFIGYRIETRYGKELVENAEEILQKLR